MSTKKSKGKGSFATVMIVFLSILLCIFVFAIFIGLSKGYRGDRKATEADVSGITRGYYEEVAYTYVRTMFNNDSISGKTEKGLAVGEYYNAAMIEKAYEQMGETVDKRLTDSMEDSRMRMGGEYAIIADRIDELLGEVIDKAWE